MALKNFEDYSNYVSISEVIKIFDKKYKLFENNNNSGVVSKYNANLKDSLKKKITFTIKEQKNGIDYVKQTNDKRQYLISYQSVPTLMRLLENYVIERSITMNDQALKKRDDAIQSRQLSNISKNRMDRSLIVTEIQNKMRSIDFDQLDNEAAEVADKMAYDWLPKITETDLQKYEQINSDFEKQLIQSLQLTKLEITFQNGLQHRYTEFDQAGYIKDYCLRELHTVQIQGKRIIYRGYSKYDLKLQNPLYWYCG